MLLSKKRSGKTPSKIIGDLNKDASHNIYPTMMTLDTQIFFPLNSLVGKSSFLDSLILFCASYLPILILLGLLVWLYFLSATRREKIEILVVSLASATIARYGVTEIIRYFYHRPRPYVTYTQIHNLLTDSAWSFPSGHAAFFFALSAAIYMYNKKWGKIFFIASAFVCLGRVAGGVHYPSDIIAGLTVGLAVGFVTYHLAKNWRAKLLKSPTSELTK